MHLYSSMQKKIFFFGGEAQFFWGEVKVTVTSIIQINFIHDQSRARAHNDIHLCVAVGHG